MKNNVIKSQDFNEWSRDKPLYKFLKSEYADNLFNNGELRIGTLYDFRNHEAYGNKRGDKDEGQKAIYENVNTLVESAENNTLSPFVKQVFSIKQGVTNIRIENITVSQPLNSADCYIYCMSYEFNENLYEEFQADVCIEIKSPYKFIGAISKCFKNSDFIKLSKIIYTQRNQPYGQHDEYHAATIKSENYKPQKEVRSIWVPRYKNSIEPLLVKIQPRLIRRYCRIFHKKQIL